MPRLRNSRDRRSLLWMLVLAPAVVAIQFAKPALVPYLFWISCYFGLAAGVIAHNHNHCATFDDPRANRWFGNWLSLFYGYPTFVWIPTHNRNHHKLVNTEGDATITWRLTNRHNILVAATYFFVSAYYQSVPINEFIADAKENNTRLHRRIITQYVIWAGAYAALLALAISLHGLSTGLFVAVMSVGLPAVFSLWAIMLFNYEQHVHTDPWSDHDHSRAGPEVVGGTCLE